MPSRNRRVCSFNVQRFIVGAEKWVSAYRYAGHVRIPAVNRRRESSSSIAESNVAQGVGASALSRDTRKKGQEGICPILPD